MTKRDEILTALGRWIRQRPGLEFGNYGDLKAYRAEVRAIGRDLRDARTLLRYVERSQLLLHIYSYHFSLSPLSIEPEFQPFDLFLCRKQGFSTLAQHGLEVIPFGSRFVTLAPQP